MTSHNFDLDYVELNRPSPPYETNTSGSTIPQSTTTPSQVTIVHDQPPRPDSGPRAHQEVPSPSPQSTDVPYAPTPPPAPTPPSIPSESEIYGPDRLFGQSHSPNENAGRSIIPSPGVRFDQSQFPLMAVLRDPSQSRDFKDDLARAAGVVTPGVDDTPNIRYALDAMTRVDDHGRGMSGYPESDSGESYQPAYHFTPTTVSSPLKSGSVPLPTEAVRSDNIPRHWPMPPHPAPVASPSTSTAEEELRERRQLRREGTRLFVEDPWDVDLVTAIATGDHEKGPSQPDQQRSEQAFQPRLQPQHNIPRTINHWQTRSDLVMDPEMGLHSRGKALNLEAPLTLKPWVLRSQSLLLLGVLCVLMIVGLMFSAIYSMGHNGLTPYAGTIYGGQYFLFRMLPQLLAVIILLYAQCVIAAAFWVLPFSNMASEDRNERRDAVFLPLYPKSFLWPELIGTWNIWIPILNVWLLNFTIPLQSSLFTVILVDGGWTWATVQGVAWTLVALYVSFLLALVVIYVYWRQRRTGMMQKWGIRTVADIIFLVAQSNSVAQYHGLETAPTRRSIKERLVGKAERLGFWFAPEAPEIGTWYGIGVPTGEENFATEKMGNPEWANRQRQAGFSETGERPGSPGVYSRYLPWCFRDSQIALFAVASSILLIALIIVSFLHSTDLRNGFLPLLSAAPSPGAFSPADFLYSFLPSLLGLILFLLFQPLDLTLRILTPWGELARAEGSRAETSLLLDYATCLPFESTYKALRNRHWRVAFVSLISPLFALLPVLGGGLFLALTPPSGAVRMYPNVPAFAIILALLFLYVAGVICLVPNRQQFRLPHAVTCLAEVFSFCCDEQLLADEAFDLHMMLESKDLANRLDTGKDWHRQGRWAFNAGRNNDQQLGVKRYSKYTVNPKKLRTYDKRARGQLISLPLSRPNGPFLNR